MQGVQWMAPDQPTTTAVEIYYADGRWYPGTLERWRHDPDRGWIGYVWWSEGAGLRHVEWIPADRLRPAQDGDEVFAEPSDERTCMDPHGDAAGHGPGVV